jgi:DNA-binding MarR family transcriptional regulator
MKQSLRTSILEQSLGHQAARFTRVMLRRINATLAQHGFPITSDQYSFLVQLWDRDGLPQGVLADAIAKEKTTMARLAAGLEALGLIARLPSPNDARERLIFLTDKGKKMMDEATGLVREILAEAQQGIDATELDICRDILRRAFLNLQK